MTPELIESLSKLPDLKEFIKYLAEKALEIDTLQDIDLNNPYEATIEMKGRKLAVKKIKEILKDLIPAMEYVKISNIQKGEYDIT